MDPNPQLLESPDLRAVQSLTAGIAGKVLLTGDTPQSPGVWAEDRHYRDGEPPLS